VYKSLRKRNFNKVAQIVQRIWAGWLSKHEIDAVKLLVIHLHRSNEFYAMRLDDSRPVSRIALQIASIIDWQFVRGRRCGWRVLLPQNNGSHLFQYQIKFPSRLHSIHTARAFARRYIVCCIHASSLSAKSLDFRSKSRISMCPVMLTDK